VKFPFFEHWHESNLCRSDSKYDTHTVEIINQFNEDMKIIKSWITENPDFLLVVMSDHGGAWPDDNILR
jgi:hypothetical protein